MTNFYHIEYDDNKKHCAERCIKLNLTDCICFRSEDFDDYVDFCEYQQDKNCKGYHANNS